VLQGASSGASGSVFGQGVRCVSGSFKRTYMLTRAPPHSATRSRPGRTATTGSTTATRTCSAAALRPPRTTSRSSSTCSGHPERP
jgi:hypothetical protein